MDREIEVAIAGAHGRIGRLLGALLVERGHSVLGLIRATEQEEDLRTIGVEPVLCDLERDEEVSEAVAGVDAVVFAAGAGPGSGAERQWTMDFCGAGKLIDAPREKGGPRYAMVSAMGAAAPPAVGGEVFGEYLRAKAAADQRLRESGLDHTIVRPGMLTDDPPTNRVSIAERLERGEIPRADVAAVVAAALVAPNAIGRGVDLVAGPTPGAEAGGGRWAPRAPP